MTQAQTQIQTQAQIPTQAPTQVVHNCKRGDLVLGPPYNLDVPLYRCIQTFTGEDGTKLYHISPGAEELGTLNDPDDSEDPDNPVLLFRGDQIEPLAGKKFIAWNQTIYKRVGDDFEHLCMTKTPQTARELAHALEGDPEDDPAATFDWGALQQLRKLGEGSY